MRYLVTGSTGFLGSHLVRQLIDRDEEVVALVRSPEKAGDLPDEVEVAIGDVTEKTSMRGAMRDVDGIFHLAALAQIGNVDPGRAASVNVDGTRNVLELMAELDVEKGVYTSSIGVFSDTGGEYVDETYRYEGPHRSVYDRTKWEAHYEVAEPAIQDGLPLVIVMPAAIYGPPIVPEWGVSGSRRIWRRYLREELPFVVTGGATCWEHVEDSARAQRLAMDAGTPGETYIITGEGRSFVEIFELAERLTGIPAPRPISYRLIRAIVPLIRQLERVVTPPSAVQSEVLERVAGVTSLADNAKATRELGVTHRSLEEGFGAYFGWERAQLDRG